MSRNHTQRNASSGPAESFSGTVVFDAVACPAATVTTQSIPLADVKPGDIVLVAPIDGALSVAVAIGVGGCAVAGTALVPFSNPTAGALDPASETYSFRILRDH